MFVGRQRCAAGFQFQADKNNHKRRRGFLPARYVDRGWTGIHIGRRENRERARRRGENKSRQTRDSDVIGVGIAAEAVAKEFEAVGDGGDARRSGNRLCGGRNIGRCQDSARHATAAPFDAGENGAEIERSDEESASSYVGGDLVSIGEDHCNARRKAAGDIENRECGALSANQLVREKQDARARRSRRLLGSAESEAEAEADAEKRRDQWPGRSAHKAIVEEIAAGKKGGWRIRRISLGDTVGLRAFRVFLRTGRMGRLSEGG